MRSSPPPPATEKELLIRAAELAGRRLEDLATEWAYPLPSDLKRAKGWLGVFVEHMLGATAKSRAEPDFLELGVELKTIPVSRLGTPVETTFVCTIPLLDVGDLEWPDSRVYKKLRRVLWMPVLGERSICVGDRVLGSPLLWSPSPSQEAALRWDWEELAGLIGRGDFDRISGHLGEVMQVRPKAANSRARRQAMDSDGCRVQVLPRGFYLRTSFTAKILSDAFRLPSP